jgi:hypothetical protein
MTDDLLTCKSVHPAVLPQRGVHAIACTSYFPDPDYSCATSASALADIVMLFHSNKILFYRQHTQQLICTSADPLYMHSLRYPQVGGSYIGCPVRSSSYARVDLCSSLTQLCCLPRCMGGLT